jgi:hypothetical protein
MREEQRWCAMSDCVTAGQCFVLADLNALLANRAGLEGEYGWDVISFIGEAKHQYRLARRHQCPLLGRVLEQAQRLAPEVDFSRVT